MGEGEKVSVLFVSRSEAFNKGLFLKSRDHRLYWSGLQSYLEPEVG